jgi:hypothetical protein
MLGKLSIRRAFSFGISLTAVSSLIGACGSDDEKAINLAKLSQGCSLNSQCENPLVCTFAHCHRQCDDDRDCRGEERCVKGESGHVCQLAADTACTTAKDCNGTQVCGVDKECRDKCTADSDCTTSTRGADQVCAQSGECASTDPKKDTVDGMGNIQPDPFDDTKDSGAGGASGAGGSGGASGSSGSDGSGGSGTGGMDASPDSSVGGTAGTAGAAGTGGAGTGGAAGTAGASGTGGAGTGGTGGSSTDGGVDAGCPTGTAECDGNPNTPCETSLALPTSCGGCNTSCNPQNGTVHCDAATYRCVVDSCSTGYDNCDNDGSNGCESRLTDNPNHCGQCGRSCGGGTCTTSLCSAAIVMDPGGPTTTSYFYDMQLVGNRIVASIYVGTSYELRTVTLPPTTPPSEGTVLHPFPTSAARQDNTLAADATHVYWATSSSSGTVYRKPIDNPSANIEPMFNAPSGGYIYKLILGTAFYYWGYVGGSGAGTGYGFFTAAKMPGTSAQAITGLTGTPPMFQSGSVGGFVVASSRLFYASYNSTDVEHQLLTAPAGGGAPTTLDDTIGSYNSVGVVSDGTYVYWNTYVADGRIRRVAIATPTTASIQNVALSVASPGAGLYVDATHVYYMDGSQNVWRALKDGSAIPQRVLTRSGSIYLTSIAAGDATYLYGPSNTGAIVRVNKTP